MKLSDKFILHTTNDETILVPTGDADFSGIVRGNNTFGKVLELLKNDTSEEEIVAEMKKIFEASENAIENDVHRALKELRKIGAVDE